MRAFLLALAVLIAPGVAHPHDSWINQGNYSSPVDGVHCCGAGDCASLDESDVTRVEGGWFIQSLDEFVPDAETQIGEDGSFWRCHRSDGSRRCFFSAQGGS